MAEFGKRNSGGATIAHHRPEVASADLSAAIAAVKTGKMPAWAKMALHHHLIFLVVGAVLLWFLSVTYGGAILRDHRLAGTWQTAYDLKVVDGKCTRYNFVVTTCSASIVSVAEPTQSPVAIEYLMLFTSGGGEILTAVRSTSEPSAVTIAYAAERVLWNRTLTFALTAGIFAPLGLSSFSSLLAGRYKGGAAHQRLLEGFAELKTRFEHVQAQRQATI